MKALNVITYPPAYGAEFSVFLTKSIDLTIKHNVGVCFPVLCLQVPSLSYCT